MKQINSPEDMVRFSNATIHLLQNLCKMDDHMEMTAVLMSAIINIAIQGCSDNGILNRGKAREARDFIISKLRATINDVIDQAKQLDGTSL